MLAFKKKESSSVSLIHDKPGEMAAAHRDKKYVNIGIRNRGCAALVSGMRTSSARGPHFFGQRTIVRVDGREWTSGRVDVVDAGSFRLCVSVLKASGPG